MRTTVSLVLSMTSLLLAGAAHATAILPISGPNSLGVDNTSGIALITTETAGVSSFQFDSLTARSTGPIGMVYGPVILRSDSMCIGSALDNCNIYGANR